MRKIKLTKENEVSIKKSLIEFGLSKAIVENLKYGYYVYDDIGIYEVSNEEFLKLQAKELLHPIVGVASGGTKMILENAKLSTGQYNGVNKFGKLSGHGYAFEDISNRKFRKAGYKVDSSIGKTCEKGGADAIFTNKDGNAFEVQYKCTSSAELAANKIMKENGYPGQMLYVNTEVAKDLQLELKKMEIEGKVPRGTADRVVDAGITRNEAIKVSKFCTKESLSFDAKTAMPTLIVAFVVTGVIVFVHNFEKEGKVNKKVIRKTLAAGLLSGVSLFLVHIAFNQIKRLL